ncbi:hypothetical protein CDD80_2405 [Ophiocordyceps camponoti-rufipedis]|uniref:Uncharacterized protein n=1 Tax=Ophiocordyceps camponoti-rufipedis TaxID=2004952 RepID=A0A2C5YBE6_9HYPO|nr:hypothetical protein CDD80_2405 [Ophiocordyceps camponoti-rufipedis]
MASVKNPNCRSMNRVAAHAAKKRKTRQKLNEAARTKISKADASRGARPGLLPTSGPKARLSAKKARKLDKKLGYALKRKMEADGEAEMKECMDDLDDEEKNKSTSGGFRQWSAERQEADRRRQASEFQEFLTNNVPLAFVTDQVRHFIRREGNKRLHHARQDGIGLADLFIDQDCLPSWSARSSWDPEAETLHVAIQNTLIDFDVARGLGEFVRQELVTKGNGNLDQARSRGFGLEGLHIGPGLLPTWEPAEEEEADESDAVLSQTDDGVSRASPGLQTETPLSSAEEFEDGDDSDDDDSDDDDSDEPIFLSNALLPEPDYAEAEGSNVLHDVQLVSDDGVFDVDLEVYLVDGDDEELADLPQAELYVDREAFEREFGTNGAVDVELPQGFELFHLQHEDDDDETQFVAGSGTQPMPLPETDDSEASDEDGDEAGLSEEDEMDDDEDEEGDET